MSFGEIVEPSTRALIIDDDVELSEAERTEVSWKGKPDPPDDVDLLVFVESNRLIQLAQLILLSNLKLAAKLLGEGVEIYNDGKQFLVTYSESKTLICGEIVEIFEKWIAKASKIYSVTSSSIVLYQNDEIFPKPETLVRCLTNNGKVPFDFCEKLEAPNLITGLGAGVLSYCVYKSIKCSLFVIYMDNSPLDSINSKYFVNLMSKMGFVLKNSLLTISTGSSNLYI
ncbi:uncharacterized protein LOC132702018 [Cylas formicarius]|uniref:uncharacterized protein LOC132702018 n=1 Tax=Cylas formicarius TaxID=197179 RepID=UPI002958CAE2|nr:uncharacterized protein LOC132702018 [Cylas formicarius]